MENEIIQTGVFNKILALFSNSGFTAILASISTVIITGLFNLKLDRRREQQQFIRQILPERINANHNILCSLASLQEKTIQIMKLKPEERIKEMPLYYKEFHSVFSQNMLWLEKKIADYCQAIEDLFIRSVCNAERTG